MADSKPGRILVVDDEIDVMVPLRDFLTEIGHEVTGYLSAKEALGALKGKEFDLLITDMVLPEMDGISLLKSARKLMPHLTCIVMTGQGTIESAVEAMRVGAFDYITKPVNWKILGSNVSRAVEVARLRKSEEKYRAIVEDQAEFICRWKPDGTITFVNEVICRYFGTPCDELIGDTCRRFLTAEDYERLKKKVAVLNRENPVAFMEHRVIMPGGEIRWHRWSNRALFDEKGRILEFQSVGHDITERKRMEEELRNTHEQLRALSARLSQAEEGERKRIARELHDQVGQNLTALGINLNMLRVRLSDILTPETDSRLNDSLNLLEETVMKIRDLMTDLRPSVLDDYGLTAAIRWYGEQFSHRTGVEIVVEGRKFEPRLSPEVEITLFRIVQELLTNVAKHAMASRVTVSLAEDDGIVLLTIADNGVGFDPLISDQSGKQGGWGLLNIRERTESIGGRLTVESKPGHGTRVGINIRR
jgi:two-component system sensor histidine kinase UhpB